MAPSGLSPLSRKGHAQALLALGLPLVGGHLAQFAIGATDTMMLGWYGVPELAAGVLGHTYFFIFYLMGSGFAWAVMPMVAAESTVEGGEVQIRRITRMGLWLSVLFAALSLPLLLLAEPILLALGQPPEVVALATQYLAIAGWGLFPALAMLIVRSYLAALERTKVVFLATVAGALTNVAANWLLIFGNLGFPEMGVRGAAVASVLVQLVMLVAFCGYAVRVFPHHTLFARIWRADWPAFWQVFRLGWPIGITTVAEVGLFAASAILVGWFGAVSLAAHGIALQIATASFMVHLGLANAATVRAGQAWGRHDAGGLADGALSAMAMSLAFSAATVVLFLTIPETLIGLFLGEDEPARAEILALGTSLLILAAAFQTFDGAQVMAVSLLRGVQDTRVPMVMAAFSYWGVGLPASYVGGFVIGWGVEGVWVGLVAGLAAAAALLSWRFFGWALRRARSSARIDESDASDPQAEPGKLA